MELPKSYQHAVQSGEPSAWRANHGNLLLCVIAVILLIGSAVIAYRQTRSRSPRYPSRYFFTDAETDGFQQMGTAGMGGERQMIVVRVIGAVSDEGTMKLAVYTRPEGFNDPELALGVDSWRIQQGICEGRFDLPAEIQQLAIAAFHDANNNGILDRNALGIPSERYGFTGDARGLAGPPDFSEAVVPITGEAIQISIR